MTQVILMIVSFVCAALVAYALTPAVRVLAFKLGAVDVPLDKRRVHKKPVPRIGGLAIYVSFLAASAIFCDIDRVLVTIWIGGFVLVVLGVLDDIFRLNAFLKLGVQVAVAVFAVLNGSVIEHVYINDGFVSLGVFGIILSVLWIAGLTNAINFIDGLDGLACGVSAIATASMLAVVLLNGDYVSAGFCLIMLGSCLGFLPFNKNPAKIFMGDTGAMFLGFAMAIMSINGTFKLHTLLSFIVPILIFAIPIFDGLFSIIRRLVHGKSPFAPDRGHIHHRLIDMGFTQKETVKILYSVCGIMGLVAVCFTDIIPESSRLIRTIAVMLIAVFIFIINYIILKSPYGRKHSGISDEEMTTEEYLKELDEKHAEKIKEHNTEHSDAGDGPETPDGGAEEK